MQDPVHKQYFFSLKVIIISNTKSSVRIWEMKRLWSFAANNYNIFADHYLLESESSVNSFVHIVPVDHSGSICSTWHP